MQGRTQERLSLCSILLLLFAVTLFTFAQAAPQVAPSGEPDDVAVEDGGDITSAVNDRLPASMADIIKATDDEDVPTAPGVLIQSRDEPACTPINMPAADWKSDTDYATASLVRYGGRLYGCLQRHRSHPGWEPPHVPALWATPTPCGVTAWEVQTQYKIGSKVTFERENYQCQEAHISSEGWTPLATPSLWNKVQLIRSIRISKSNVQFGESFRVFVRLTEPEGFRVFINGVPGSSQWFQFYDFPGIHKVTVAVYRREDFIETRSVDILVENPQDLPLKAKFPYMAMSSPEAGAGYFEILNFADIHVPGTVYTWDFGRAGSRTTTGPSVKQLFEDYLDINEPYGTFEVRVTAAYPGQSPVSATRSVVVWNTYFLEKARGFVKPKLDYNFRAVRQDKKLAGSCRIKNVEPEPLHLTKKAFQYLTEDSEFAQMFAPEEAISVRVPANKAADIDCGIPFPLPRGSFGYAVHLAGQTDAGKRVRTSCYFEYRESTQGSGTRIITDPNAVRALHSMRNQSLHHDKAFFTRDEVIRHIRIVEGVSTRPNVKILRENITAGKEEMPDIRAFSGEVLLGKPCLPDEDPPEVGVTCQLTDEWAWVTIPARIANAFKGDAILSPAGNGVIGGLLRQVDPPQAYAHSGIMTKNHYEIRHSTASEDRMHGHLVGSVLGERGTDGIDPDVLKYAWPGTITQSVQGAFNGEDLVDPDTGKPYRISAFDYRTRQDQGMKLIPALILKPDPFKEALIPSVRTTLHRVADAAAAIKGHYRFYAYTNAGISTRSTSYNAPDRGSTWWASNTTPTVCSSLLWAAAKSVVNPRIQLEGAGMITLPYELEPQDVAAGARIDSQTLDGLYMYSAEERLTAAEWLYGYMWNLAADKIHKKFPWLPASWVGDAPDDLGNQMVNTFNSDWTGDNGDGRGHSKDSDNWKNMGLGHAVSPDHLLFWDAPGPIVNGVQKGLYGYTEKLVYRPETYEYRHISRWKLIKTTGTVTGTVSYHGRAVGRGNSLDGSFTIGDVPAGTFKVKAGKLIERVYAEGALSISVTANSTTSVAITLQDPPEFYREVVLSGSLYIRDDQLISSNSRKYGMYYDGIFVGPFGTHAEQVHKEGHGGEIRVEVYVKMDWKFPGDIAGTVYVKFYEGRNEDTGDLEDKETEQFRVARGSRETVRIHVVSSGVGGGDTADLTSLPIVPT
ncbi:hypothetical protein FOXG_15172 [Fusarium oxysporum f. sp. lycopersici 4287]|uniref:Chitin-binding type-3 domain-containing protein n=1 Tax=Fusarium oxysporum f. sp. lycopersici (strain 4287 / CBS 123668 / FGSC 9935 / NRRL 34936) TaxID=426428 RepID=A0A0J9WUF9_FUSO4|nr:hypothetical protein FOXG_15172 [Fusarium oxysporum f. sp. lycopersici 4287]KNB17712.1 hypothetical protein FOXG_15172 [Fusarium oxysporum f. sp. lycopersici 4287]